MKSWDLMGGYLLKLLLSNLGRSLKSVRQTG